MIPIKTDLKTWPRRRNGEPIFRTATDAIFYAQLASKTIHAVDEMKKYRKKAHQDLQHVRKGKNPNSDRLMEYAVKAQFFRECWEEIERINGEDKQ
ncbi:hypothetical protein ES702_05755 [subsurface metagenome]